MSQKQHEIRAVKVYKRRWIVLGIYILLAAVSAFQWIQYSIITNIIMRYYKVSSVAVDWTSIIYMAIYTPLIIPASYIIDKKGVRVGMLIGGAGTTLGTILKIFSVNTDMFWLVLLCQGIVAATQTLILGLPPKLAAIWFGPNQVSRACALGIFGSQLGVALGFILPPVFVKNYDDIEQIGDDLYFLTCLVAGAMTIVFTAIVLYFPNRPPLPPSRIQLNARNTTSEIKTETFLSFFNTLRNNKAFLLHTIASGIDGAVYGAFATLLGQATPAYFENGEELAGRLGLIMVIMGMCGSISMGFILDKTRKYKECCLYTYILTFLSISGFICVLEYKSRTLVYIVIIILGYFLDAYFNASMEFSVELTHPLSESTTASILLSIAQVFGCLVTMETGWLYANCGAFWALFSLACILLLGSIMTAFIPNKLRRQAAIEEANDKILHVEYVSVQDKEDI